MDERLLQISLWHKKGGVLIISYDLFRSLVANKPNKKSNKPPLNPREHETLQKQLFEGPNIVVADEAHKMKNQKSGIGMVATLFATTSRIALTGSPLANNLGDYYAMIDWVAPGYLGELSEFNAHYKVPIEEGTYADSSKFEQRRSLKKLHALKTDIDPKVSRSE